MGSNSKIEWTDHTWNGWRGCAHAPLADGTTHPGCDNCYAAKMAPRNPKVLGVWGQDGQRVAGADDYWDLPRKWNDKAAAAGVRERVFALSLGDVFEDWKGIVRGVCGLPLHHGSAWGASERFVERDVCIGKSLVTMSELRHAMFREIIDRTPWLEWLILTKRPQNIRRLWPARGKHYEGPGWNSSLVSPHFRPNVSLLTSVSDQKTAAELVPHLLGAHDLCPVLGLSCEPLLGQIDLIDWIERIDWVIAGGESGPASRPMHPGWPRFLRDQCQAAGVPFFFKQWGEYIPHSQAMQIDDFPVAETDWAYNLGDDDDCARIGKKAAGRTLDGRQWSEFPEGTKANCAG